MGANEPLKKADKVLTISVAAYNVEKTIKRTLDSLVVDVPEEIRRELEVIVVNDGSSDKTESIVRMYESLYPECIRLINKENGGWGSTVNVSLHEACGRYYRLLDGDDWVDTENLSEYLDFLSRAEADVVLSPYLKVYSQNAVEENRHKEIGSKVCLIEELDTQHDIYMHEIAVRTEVIREKWVDITEKCFYTDNEYVFEIVLASRTIQRFDKKIYMYRLGDTGQSVGRDGLRKHHKDTIKVSEKINRRYYGYLEAVGEDGFKQVKLELLRKRVIHITDLVYVSYLLTENKEAKSELKDFDRNLQVIYPQIDKLMEKNKKIRLLRISAFYLYWIISKLLNKRYAVMTHQSQ